MKKPLVLTFLAALLALGLLAGCGDSDSDSGGETTTAAACEPGQLETVSDGTLTVATDKPAYPPYFEDDEPAAGHVTNPTRPLIRRWNELASATASAATKGTSCGAWPGIVTRRNAIFWPLMTGASIGPR